MDPFIRTIGGRKFYFLHDDDTSQINLHDIATHLSRLCRFTGATVEHYSVAQHSVLVSRLLPPELRVWGLLHDAAEAYLGDCSNPLKSLLPDYKGIQHRVERRVCMKFGLPWPEPKEVKAADWRVFAAEQRDLMPPCDEVCNLPADIVPIPERIHPLDWRHARLQFITESMKLGLSSYL